MGAIEYLIFRKWVLRKFDYVLVLCHV